MIVGEQIDHAEFKQRCRRMTDEQLRFVLRDCRETIDNWRSTQAVLNFHHRRDGGVTLPDHPNEGKYLDQMHYAADELNRRHKK
tara:strand:+ start:351 stop:602 length:252 start_codon:yes stop_codon:yes gene_type:complete